jgi:hypothetical protein
VATIILQGFVTAEGELKLVLPPNFPPGEVEVEIRQTTVEGVLLSEILNSGLVGAWSDRDDITDSVEYARNLRRRASRRDTE